MLNAIKFILGAIAFYGSLWLMLAILAVLPGFKGKTMTYKTRQQAHDALQVLSLLP
jgi:hypothetical protein